MHKMIFNDKKSRHIRLETNNDFIEVTAYFENERIGYFSFDLCENDDEDFFLVTNMYLEDLPGFKRCGIGTSIIDWVEDETGYSVVFGRDDGFKSNDGSHLTGNGPAFADFIINRRKKNLLK